MRHIAAVRALVGVMALVLASSMLASPGSMLASPGVASSPEPSASAPVPRLATQGVLILQLSSRDGSILTGSQVADAASMVSRRLEALPGAGGLVRVIPGDRLRIDLADDTELDAVRRIATAGGDLQFVPVPVEFADSIVDGELLPAGMPVEPLFGGESIAEFSVASDQLGQPGIDIVFDAVAARLFDDWAAAHISERFAMVLDGLVIAAPVIRTGTFDGHAQISGNFDLPQVQQLVAILKGGVLPVTAEVMTVCPAVDECPVPAPSVSPTAVG